MHNKLGNLFHQLDHTGPSPRLLDAALQDIRHRQRRALAIRGLAPLFAGLTLSVAALVYAIAALITQAVNSGLLGFLSMLATDTGAVLTSWQSYIMTVLDDLPSAPLAGAFAALFLFFVLLRRFDKVFTATAHITTL